MGDKKSRIEIFLCKDRKGFCEKVIKIVENESKQIFIPYAGPGALSDLIYVLKTLDNVRCKVIDNTQKKKGVN